MKWQEIRSLKENSIIAIVRSSNGHSHVKGIKSMIKSLRDWALRYNIRTYCLRDLLKILRSIGVPFILKDPATFLRTPNVIETERIANGEFWYAGISKNLRRILQAADEPMELSLNIHVDGMRLFNSSSKQFWPILGQIHGWYTNSNDCS